MRPLDPRLLRYSAAARGYLAVTVVLGLAATALILLQASLLAALAVNAYRNTRRAGLDLAHAAAEGLWESASTVATAGDVQKIVESWSGGALKSVAADLARQYAAAAPRTAADRSALAQALATGLSAAAFTATGLP